jgi:predicted transcriptional regulator of viral defense system
MDAEPFTGEIISGVEDACHHRERNAHERTSVRHFNIPISHNIKTIRGQFEQPGIQDVTWKKN